MESKSQLTEAKRKNEEEAEVITRLEENRKKSMKDLEELTHKLEEVQAANDKLEKSKRKLASYFFSLSNWRVSQTDCYDLKRK